MSAPPELREAARVPGGTRRSRAGREGRRGRRGRRGTVALAVVVAVLAVVVAAWPEGPPVRAEGLALVGDFAAAALDPARDARFLRLVAEAAVTTVAYAVLGTLLALVLGAVGGVASSETWWIAGRHGRARRRGTAGWVVVKALLVVPRGIHEVIWGLVLLAVLGLTPLVAVLAIGIPFGAVTAKVFAELIDEAPSRPYRAALAAGVPRLTALVHTVLPVAFGDLVSYAFYRFECAIRSAAILGLVGAGGLGFQLALSLQTLDHREIWTILYVLIALCAAGDAASAAVRRGHRRVALVVGAVLALGAPVWVQLDLGVLVEAGTWSLVTGIVADAWPPTLGTGTAGGLLAAAATTVAMSVLAIALAFVGGSLLAFPAAAQRGDRTGRRLLVLVARGVLIVLRAVPPPVWALLFLFVLAPGLLPGALALAAYTVGVLGRLMAGSVENLDPRPPEALRAAGASRAVALGYAVVPAAAPRFVAFGLYRWEVTIRETVVVGVVGAGGLGLLLSEQLAAFDHAAALTTLAAIVALTAVVDATSAVVRRTLRA